MTYVDSSVLLAVYLDQPESDRGRAVLAEDPALVSSWLLAIEVPVVLRRAFGGKRDARRLSAALARFDGDLAAIGLVAGLPEVADRVRRDPRLADCRSLDAIHAATALIIRELSGRPLRLVTFDARLSQVAERLAPEIGAV